MAKSYNCYGGHTTLSPIGDFLLMGAGDFGDAIRELTVTLHFPDSGPAKKTLEQLLERHNSYRSTLPKITYRKAKGKVYSRPPVKFAMYRESLFDTTCLNSSESRSNP